jgi:hypothetical protein
LLVRSACALKMPFSDQSMRGIPTCRSLVGEGCHEPVVISVFGPLPGIITLIVVNYYRY